MSNHSFEKINAANLKFRLPKKANTHNGYMANIYDQDSSMVTFTSPIVKIPFPVTYGSLSVFEDYDAEAEPETGNHELPTHFSQFIQTLYDVCYASFDAMRDDKARAGVEWGTETAAPYPIVTKTSKYSEVADKRYTSMKYNFKCFKNNETGNYDTFLCNDSFNQSVKLEPRPGLKGRLFLQLHSWYYDQMRGKFNARIYIKGIQLEPTHEAGKDIREWMDTPKAAF